MKYSIEDAIKILERGVVDLISKNDLIEKLKQNRPLRIKLGADPSAPDIHLGHVVVLRKLKQFQELGHEITFLIGDFTGMIGDPTGKSKTRIPLTAEQVKENAKSYQEQIFRILDPKKTIIRFNSEWSRPMKFEDVIGLTSRYTLARLLEREDFMKRYQNQQSITITELLYPLVQGYDSVAMETDVELGGTDQLFNLLVGRELQREYGQAPQIVMTVPLLEGLDGKNKMSKSLGNYIAISDSPKDMFGKTMSIPDELIIRYFLLLTDLPTAEIDIIEQGIKAGENPRDHKIRLAKAIVSDFHSPSAAERAYEEFVTIFSKGGLPDDICEITISTADLQKPAVNVLVNILPNTSKSEIRRLISSGAVKINEVKVGEPNDILMLKENDILKIGKRQFFKIKF